jgi:hypothetical protein
VLVERSQAGLPVTCTCGATLEVPTIRGFARLEVVPTASDDSAWTTQHGLLLIGVLVALVAGGAAAWRVVTMPADAYSGTAIDEFMKQKAEEIDQWTPGEVVEAWQQFRAGPYVEDPADEKRYYARRAAYMRWNWVLAGVAAAGALFCVVVLATGAGNPRSAPPARRAGQRR